MSICEAGNRRIAARHRPQANGRRWPSCRPNAAWAEWRVTHQNADTQPRRLSVKRDEKNEKSAANNEQQMLLEGHGLFP
jgi:hypothetical protein